MKRSILMMAALMMLVGCAHTSPSPMPADWMTQVEAMPSAPRQTADGSLWVGAGTTTHLFADRRASVPGDVLTVQVVEEAKAKKTASTSTKRESGTDAKLGAMLGLGTSILQSNPNMGSEIAVGAETKNDFTGEGETLREGTLTTTLTVRVMQVLPNGHLVISGSRTLKVNNEVQLLGLRGVVDPRDISVDNTIVSTKIAEAQIEFFGQGVLGDKQHPGWLQRGMDWLWPF